jgi:hypothetical protein
VGGARSQAQSFGSGMAATAGADAGTEPPTSYPGRLQQWCCTLPVMAVAIRSNKAKVSEALLRMMERVADGTRRSVIQRTMVANIDFKAARHRNIDRCRCQRGWAEHNNGRSGATGAGTHFVVAVRGTGC